MPRIITPVNNQILLRKREANGRTASGLYKPETATDGETFEAEVLAVGPGKFVEYHANTNYQLVPPHGPDDRKPHERDLVLAMFSPMPCKAGDVVIVSSMNQGNNLEDGLFLVCDHDVLATVQAGN